MRLLMTGASSSVAMSRVVAWMLKRGHEVWLLDYSNRYQGEGLAQLHFVRFRARGAGRLKRLGSGALAGLTWLGALQMRMTVARVRPDIVHAHWLTFHTHCAARAGIHPLVVSAWAGFNHLLLPGHRFGDARIAEQIALTADAIIIETPTLVEPMQALVPRPKRVEEIPLGVDTDRFRPGRSPAALRARREARVPDEAVVFLSPRAWEPFYGHHLILDAFARAYGRFERPTLLAFLAYRHTMQSAGYYKQLRARAEELGVGDNLRWLQPVPHGKMPLLYTMADAVISYPASDAFPSTLLEAAACETPVLTAALPTYQGTPLATHFTNVEPENPAALAEAMVRLVNEDPRERAPRLAAARQVITERYEEEQMMAKLLVLYQNLI